MSGYTIYGRGFGRYLGGLSLALMLATGCGDTFGSEDCKASRTCADPSQGGEGGERPSLPEGGGESGAESPEPECTAAKDCTNGDARDGVELCVNGECRAGDAPPRVIAVSPEADATGVEPNAPIVIELSEALDPTTVTVDTVQVRYSDTPLAGELSYEGEVVTFVPALPLTLNATFQVWLSEEVTDASGTPLLEPFTADFSVRDGSWHVTDVPGPISYLSPTLPMTATGSLLIAWSGTGAQTCPVKAAWLELGATALTPVSFTQTAASCQSVLAGGAEGVGVVSWNAAGPNYLQQYRAGAWQSKPLQVTGSSEFYVVALAVSPLGIAHRFEAADAGGVWARRTNADGAWQLDVAEVAPTGVHLQGSPSIAFDREGNGLAVFNAHDANSLKMRIMMSTYSAQTDAWSDALDLPGSTSEPSADFESRGIPNVSLAPTGEAVVLWRQGVDKRELMANYFDPEGGWSEPALVSGTTSVSVTAAASSVGNQPGLTFDGERFVAAWLGTPDDGVRRVFSAAYDPEAGWASPEGHDAKRELPEFEHPQVVSDSHGSLLLVWRTGAPSNYPMVQRRYVAGAWRPIELLPSGTRFGVSVPKAPLTMNQSGVAAMTWATESSQYDLTAIHVARFY